MEEKLMCGFCGTKGTKEEFTNKKGKQRCPYCMIDSYVDTVENHKNNNK